MKKNILILLSLLLCSGVTFGQFTINESVLTAYTGMDVNVIIPSEVTKIDNEVFKNNTTIMSISGENVTEIGTSAFEGATALERISFPALTSLGTGKNFYGCISLETVELGNLTYAGGNNAADAFSSCPIKNATLHTTTIYGFYGTANRLKPLLDAENITFTALQTIGDNAFSGKSNLKSIILGGSVTQIGNNAFKNCTKLTQIDLAGVKTLGTEVFSGCTTLTSVELPASLSSCGGSVFAGCSQLTSISLAADNTAFKTVDGVLYNSAGTILNSFPAGRTGDFTAINDVKTVKNGAFHTSLITNVTLPEVEKLENHAFAYCKNLITFSAPKLKTIDDHAFRQLTGKIPQITSMVLPSIVTLNANSLSGLVNLTTLDLSDATGLTTVNTSSIADLSGLTITVATQAIKDLFPTGKQYIVVVKTPTGMSENKFAEYVISRNAGTISFDGLSNETFVSISNILGKTMYQNTVKGSLSINIANYPQGVYIIKVGKNASKIIL